MRNRQAALAHRYIKKRNMDWVKSYYMKTAPQHTQTNSVLENKLQSAAQGMEGERERLNQPISGLTKHLADAKCANSVEKFNLGDAMNQVVSPITPPPAEFMDIHDYDNTNPGGQDQCLGPVPEEEESDWSEIGDDTPRFVLTGSNRVGQVWRHRDADMDKDSESGGEEILRRQMQIPHLQFTIHNENLSEALTGEGTYRITTSPNVGSTILIRSASLEEIPLARHHMQKELRGTEAMMDLHHQGGEAVEDLDNEIIHHWRTSNERDVAVVRPSEADLAGLQSAERMLNHFIGGPQAGVEQGQGRAEVNVWTDEGIKAERTKL
ncbi:hypothetical protein KUCAC02_003422 [Chaenocephalus aceratus]|uniref:Uncharacterized protein n=1 Tax=Chaenocephalus aceratus TaxID=36190 RepID=A0ACB9WKR1_CHAAC|nr:hypothetical protein KUCAC02_003422 [Chaenocephalus aceratus]